MKTLRMLLLLLFISNICHAEVVNSVLALVGNIPITSIDFESRKQYLGILAQMERRKVTDEDVYNDLINERVISIKAIENKIEVTDREIEREMDRIRQANNIADIKTFESLIEKQGMSLYEYRISLKKQIMIQNLYSVAIRGKEVTDEEADAYYAQSKGDERKYFESDTSVQVGWIFFAAKTFSEKKEKSELASEVRQKAVNGNNFASLARQYSDDSKTKNSGGNLGYYRISDLSAKKLPNHIATAVQMANNGSRQNAVSAVNENVGQGFWIVKILEIKKDEASIRSRVKNYLSQKNVEESFTNWLKEEKEKIAIKTF